MSFELAEMPVRAAGAGEPRISLAVWIGRGGTRFVVVTMNPLAQRDHLGRDVDPDKDRIQIAYDREAGLVRIQMNKGKPNTRIRRYLKGTLGFCVLPWRGVPKEPAKSVLCDVHASPADDATVIVKMPPTWRGGFAGS